MTTFMETTWKMTSLLQDIKVHFLYIQCSEMFMSFLNIVLLDLAKLPLKGLKPQVIYSVIRNFKPNAKYQIRVSIFTSLRSTSRQRIVDSNTDRLYIHIDKFCEALFYCLTFYIIRIYCQNHYTHPCVT